MASDHTADPSTFYSVVSMLDGSDVMSATQLRTIYERLHDNTAHLKARVDGALSRQAAALSLTDASFTDVTAGLVAATPFGEENSPGPVVAIKVGEAVAVFDQNTTATHPGGAITNLTSVVAAAVNPAGRIVIVGATTPYCAFKVPGGAWTGGGAEIGGTPATVLYSPAYGGFIAGRSTNIYRSTDATAWTAIAALTASFVSSLAVIGAGAGSGVVVALQGSTTPTIRVSTDNGLTWGFTGSGIPERLNADEAGNVAGCPMVSRYGLNEYVYHVSRNDSGARLRTCRSADGTAWEATATIEAPLGHTFTGGPSLRLCQSTGLAAIVVPATRTTDAATLTLVYTSVDWVHWDTPAVFPQVANTGWAVAGGKLLMSGSAALRASVGVSFGGV
jgi:hypothetical protein